MRHWLKALALLPLLLFAAPATAAPTVTEFPVPTATSEPQDIVLGPDGKLWFTELAKDKIGRVTPGNPPLIEDFDVPVNFTDPLAITVGPDGKIWFSGSFNGAGGVGRMNPANPAGTQGFGGFGIIGTSRGVAAGSDGKIWIGDSGNGAVVRVDPASGAEETISDIPINGGSFNIRNLAPGPDGNVWVTDFGGQVAKVAPTPPTGTSTTYNVDGNAAWDIVAGPDNNLWYTVPDGNRVGKITTGGAFTDFPVSAGGDQFGIAVGPDGALWFAQAVANDIGRMTLGGQFSEVKGLTAAARPEYIAAGPGNTLWFTEKDGNRIGRITGIAAPNGGPSPPPPGTDVVRPRVTDFSLSRKRFRLGGRGTRIRFTLSEDATVTIRFARRVNGQWRRVRRKLRFESTAGAHSRRFRGRFDRKHALRPGRYRMTLRARDAAGNVSAPHRARFRLLPRR